MTLRLYVQKNKEVPRLRVEFPPEMSPEQVLAVKQGIEQSLSKTKGLPINLEAPSNFREMATFIYRVYGPDSDLWRLFTTRLCPTAIPRVLQEQWDDGHLTWEQFCELYSDPYDEIGCFDWTLNDILTDALRFTVWDAARKGLSKARKGKISKKVTVQGFEVHIDRPKGFVQTGIDASGATWTRVYQCDYGFLPGTEGGDGEELDVFIGESPDEYLAYLIEQKNMKGGFDEWKLMVGFTSEMAAKECYLAHIPAQFMGACYAIPFQAVKDLHGFSPEQVKTKLAPVVKQKNYRFKSLTSAAKEAEQYILGVVLIPGEVDLQGEIYYEDTIRDACHTYMEYYRQIGDQHRRIMVHAGETPEQGAAASLVECYLSPVAFDMAGQHIPVGTWLVGMKFYDKAYWSKIVNEEITGLSMGGFVQVAGQGS